MTTLYNIKNLNYYTYTNMMSTTFFHRSEFQPPAETRRGRLYVQPKDGGMKNGWSV